MSEQSTQPSSKSQAIEELDRAARYFDKSWMDQDGYTTDAVYIYIAELEQAASAHASELRAAVDLAERLKQEAQIHAQEARTANATIAEIYKLVTGSTGEPGNWHGAEPVREYMRAAVESNRQLREALIVARKHVVLLGGEPRKCPKDNDQDQIQAAVVEIIDAAITPSEVTK